MWKKPFYNGADIAFYLDNQKELQVDEEKFLQRLNL